MVIYALPASQLHDRGELFRLVLDTGDVAGYVGWIEVWEPKGQNSNLDSVPSSCDFSQVICSLLSLYPQL